MASNIVRGPFPKEVGAGGGGPEDPMLEARVSRLESDIADMKVTLRAIEGRLSGIEVSLARMDGKLSQSPTYIQLLMAVVTTWVAGGAMVFALGSFLRP